MTPAEIVPVDPPSILRQIDVSLAGIAEAAESLAAEGDKDTLLMWLHQARHVRRTIGDLERVIEDLTADLLPRFDVYEHPNLGAVQVRGGSVRKKADWSSVESSVMPRLLAKHEGCLSDALREYLDTVVPLTPSTTPRVGALKALGLDPDEFMESAPGRKTVQIMGGEKE